MTPLIDSASTSLVMFKKQKQEKKSSFGTLNSILTRNQPLSSVDKWTYTILQTKPCSAFVEQYPPCTTHKTFSFFNLKVYVKR